jgi:hypothetical protein
MHYAVVFSNSRAPHTLTSTSTLGTFATLAEAAEYIEAADYALRTQCGGDLLQEYTEAHKKVLVDRGSGAVCGSLWIETLPSGFVETVQRLNGIEVPKPRWQVKLAEWQQEDGFWDVLVEDRLTKATKTFTLESFASEEPKPWEREGAWDGAVPAAVKSRAGTAAGEEATCWDTARRELTLGAIYASRFTDGPPPVYVGEEPRLVQYSDGSRAAAARTGEGAGPSGHRGRKGKAPRG